MKKDKESSQKMRNEYDFSKGLRGKYAKRFSKGSNVVILDPDVAAQFTTSKAVNDVLRKTFGGQRDKAAGDS